MNDCFDTLKTTDLAAEVIARAWREPGFKQLLQRDPNAALREGFGARLPAGVRLTVLEESDDQIYLVLPPGEPVEREVPPPSANGGGREAVEGEILARAAADSSFKRLLLSDPRAAIEQALGMELPAGVSVTVLEESLGQRYLVLPPDPTPSSGLRELADAELAVVAGGGRTLRPFPPNPKLDGRGRPGALVNELPGRRTRHGPGSC